ncbi:MAG: hypothetical protein COV67_09825, partial [Nitrospinae bacterium CG11_big_fil_rev_8_21_14_0_20_56_8]
MLSYLRNHADSWIIKGILWLIVFAFVATIFYSWGMGGASMARGGVVATVEGVEINFNEYDRTFNNLVNFYRDQFRNQFNEELIQKLDLKSQAIDALIQKKLLLMEAEKNRLSVSDEELIDRIKNVPSFQKDKNFNAEIYKNYLKYQHLTPAQFEDNQREALLIEKMENLVKTQVRVSEEEALDLFKLENAKVKFDYILTTQDKFDSAPAVSEEEVKAFFEENKSRFEVPERIKVEYVKLDAKKFESKVEIADEDIKEYYDVQIGKFREEKKYRASHLLFRLDPGIGNAEDSIEEKADKADKDAKARAEDALKKIRGGMSFADAAKQFSDDKTTAEKDGDLGEFPKGVMVPEFEAALEKLKAGEISPVVRTPFGYHIVHLKEVTEARVKPLDEVRDQVMADLKEIKARQLIRRIAKRVQRAAETDQNLARAAKENETTTQTTDFISQERHIVPELGPAPEFFNTAFAIGDNKASEPINTTDTSYILKVVERAMPYIPELDSVKESVTIAVQNKKNETFAMGKFQELGSRLNANPELEPIARDLKLEIKHTPYFSMTESIPGVGNIKEIKEKISGLQKGETTSVAV